MKSHSILSAVPTAIEFKLGTDRRFGGFDDRFVNGCVLYVQVTSQTTAEVKHCFSSLSDATDLLLIRSRRSTVRTCSFSSDNPTLLGCLHSAFRRPTGLPCKN